MQKTVRLMTCGMIAYLTLSAAVALADSVTIPVTKDAGRDWRGWYSTDNGQPWIYKGAGGCAAFYGDVVGQLTFPEAASVTINSATFNYRLLAAYEHSDPFTIQAFRITEEWLETVSDPANYPGPACAEGYGTVLSPLDGYISVDVTGLVQSWVDGATTNYGVLIKDSDGWSASAIYSQEVGDWRPTFTVDYTIVLKPTTAVTIPVTKDAGRDWRGWYSNDYGQPWIYKGAGGCAAFYGDVAPYLAKKPGVLSMTIASATFNYRLLAAYEHSDPFTIQAYRITEDWSASVSDPANYPGPAYAEGYGTVLSPLSGYISLDVTDLMRAWAAGTYPNYGVRIQDSDGWSASAIYSEEVGDWRPTYTVNYIANLIPNQNQAMNVPAISPITVDGNLADWPKSSGWSQNYIYWAGATELTSQTKAKFAFNGSMLYVAIQTNQANGGHAVVGYGKNIDSVAITGIGSTQLAFDALEDGHSVSIMNEIQYYTTKNGYGWGGGTTEGVEAKYSFNSADSTYTYEIAIPLWEDWRIGEAKIKQSLKPEDVVYVYSCMESVLESGIGTDLTWNGALGNPDFGFGGFAKAAALTLQATSGDANCDGMVDVGDLGILAANYGGSEKTWAQGDFNKDGLVDVGDLGILAANYGQGSVQQSNFSEDYAKAFGTTVNSEKETDDVTSSICGSLGLPLVAGLALMGLMLVKLEE